MSSAVSSDHPSTSSIVLQAAFLTAGSARRAFAQRFLFGLGRVGGRKWRIARFAVLVHLLEAPIASRTFGEVKFLS